jgi:MFS family permease
LILTIAAATVAIFPHLPAAALVPAFMIYGFFFMASYPVIEAALMESVPDAVRGRVFGFFITIGGLVGSLSHWLVGRWVHQLGPAAGSPHSFYKIYAFLGLLILLSLFGLPCLHSIRKREHLDPNSTQPTKVSGGGLVTQNPEI